VTSISRGGYGTNITTGNEIDDDHRWAVRGHLQFNFSDNVGLLLSGEYGREQDASGLFTYYSPFYVVPSAIPPAPITPAGTPPAPKGVGGFSDPNSRDGAGNIDPQLKRETRSLTGTFTWNIADNLALKNILNWRDMNYFVAQDLDLSTVVPTPITNTGVVSIPMKDRQLSNELQLTYTTDKLTLIGGLYWFTEKLSGTTFIGETPRVNVWFARAGQSDGDSYAGFFNANYKATDWLTARVGGRYNHDKRSIENTQTINGALTIPVIANTERTDSKYTGEYGLDFHFAKHGMFYYTFSQGYRQGAAVIMQTNNPILDPTTVKNHEVGFKYAADTFNVDIAVYDTKIKDLQRTQAVPLPTGAFNTLINNISGMEVKGAELNVEWAPISQLLLSGGVAYTDAKFTDYTSNDPLQFDIPQTVPASQVISDLNSRQLSGNTPQLTPKWKGNVAGNYTFAVSGDKELVVGLNAAYVGKQYFDEFNRAPMVGDSYKIWGSNITYQPSDHHWSTSLWGKNLGNEKAFADMTFSAVGIAISKKFIDPRTYGASVNYKF
jgi:iron complex outermembrane receptor protein